MREQIEAWARGLLALPHYQQDARLISLEPSDETRPLLCLMLPGWPAEGLTGYFTYGLSQTGFGDNELCLVLDTTQEAWADVLLDLLDVNRVGESFTPGAMFSSPSELVPGSAFQGWLIGLPVEELDGHLFVYPIALPEVELLKKVGMAKFLAKLGSDRYRVDRLQASI